MNLFLMSEFHFSLDYFEYTLLSVTHFNTNKFQLRKRREEKRREEKRREEKRREEKRRGPLRIEEMWAIHDNWKQKSSHSPQNMSFSFKFEIFSSKINKIILFLPLNFLPNCLVTTSSVYCFDMELALQIHSIIQI